MPKTHQQRIRCVIFSVYVCDDQKRIHKTVSYTITTIYMNIYTPFTLLWTVFCRPLNRSANSYCYLWFAPFLFGSTTHNFYSLYFWSLNAYLHVFTSLLFDTSLLLCTQMYFINEFLSSMNCNNDFDANEQDIDLKTF